MIKTRLCRTGVLSLILLLAVIQTRGQQVTGFNVAGSHESTVMYWDRYLMATVDHYTVYWSTTQGFTTPTDSITIASTAVNYTHTGRTGGTTYYYKIRAWVTVGGILYKTLLSSEVSAKPVTQTYFGGAVNDGTGRASMCNLTLNGYNTLDPPTGLDGAASHNASILTWDAYSDPAVTIYNIQWATDTGFTSPTTQQITGGVLQWVHATTTASSPYYYRIGAAYSDGCVSRNSARITVTPIAQTYVSGGYDNGASSKRICYSMLDGTAGNQPPTGFTAAASHEMNSLNWNYNAEFNQNTINWGTVSGALTNSQVFASNVLFWQQTGLTAGQSYYYKITSSFADGCPGSATAEISATPVGQTYYNGSTDDGSSKTQVCFLSLDGAQTLAPPSNFYAASSHASAVLSWDQFPDPVVNIFSVLWSTDPGFATFTNQQVTGGNLNWTQSGLTAGSPRYYKIAALYSDGCLSAYSAAQTVIPVDQTYINGSQNDGGSTLRTCPATLSGTVMNNLPLGFTIASSHNSNVIFWDYSTEFSGYTLQAATSVGGSYSTIASPGATTLFYTHAVASPAVTYYYKISGTANDGCAVAYTTPIGVLAQEQTYINGGQNDGSGMLRTCSNNLAGTAVSTAPTGLMAAASHNANVLTWDFTPGFSTYTVQYATAFAGPYSTLTTTANNITTSYSHAIASIAPYYYQITGTSNDGCVSGTSTIVSTTPVAQLYFDGSQNDGSGMQRPCISALDGTAGTSNTPANFVVAASQNANVLFWDWTANFSNYIIEYSTTSQSGPFSTLTTTANNITTYYTHNIATVGANYYRIKGTATDGCTADYSPVITCTPVAQTYFNGSQNDGGSSLRSCNASLNGAGVSNAPSGFTVAASHNSNLIFWDFSPDFSSYTLQASTTPGGTYSTIASPGSTTIYYNHTVASPAVAYYYKITGVAIDGCPVAYTSPVGASALEQAYFNGGQNEGAARALICDVEMDGFNPLAPPTNMIAATSHNSAVICWDPYSNPAYTQYNVVWANDTAFTSPTTQVVSGSNINWIHNTLTAGNPYYYKVAAVYSDGCPSRYTQRQLVIPSAQAYFNGGYDDGSGKMRTCYSTVNGAATTVVPTGLVAAGSHHANQLYWDYSSEYSQITVNWGTTPGNMTSTQAFGPTTTFWQHTGLTAAQPYYYKITSTYADGCTGGISNIVNATPIDQNYFSGSQNDGTARGIVCNLTLNGYNTLVPPTNLVASGSHNSSVLFWDTYSDPAVTTYNIMFANDTAFTSPTSQQVSGGLTNWVHNTLTAGSNYYYKIAALYADGCPSRYTGRELSIPVAQTYFNGSYDDGSGSKRTCYSSISGGATNVAPSGLVAAGSHQMNEIYWNYASEFSGFTLQSALTYGGTYSTIASPGPTTTFYQHTSLTAAQPYYYKVIGSFLDGCPSGTSDIVSAIPVDQNYFSGGVDDGSGKMQLCNVTLNGTNYVAPPTSFYAATSHNSTVLCWNAFSDPAVTQYRLLWSLNPGFTSPSTQNITGGLTNWTHNTLTAGTSYYYKLGALYNDGCLSDFTPAQLVVPVDQNYVNGSQNEGSVAIKVCPTLLSGAVQNNLPTGFTIASSHNSNVLYWDFSTEFSGYTVQSALSFGGTYSTIATTGATTTFYTHAVASPVQTNYYKIMGTASDGCPVAYTVPVGVLAQEQTYVNGGQNDGSGTIRSCSYYLSGTSGSLAPASLMSAASHNSNVLFWDYTPGYTTYTVESASALSGPYSTLYTTPNNLTTFYTHSNPSLSDYYYRLTGATTDGCISGYSDTVMVTSVAQTYFNGSQNDGSGLMRICPSFLSGSSVANAPSNFTVASSHNANMMFWDNNPSFSTYTVESGSSQSGPFTTLYTTSNNTTIYYNHSIPTISSYYYRITGTANDGCVSGYSPVVGVSPVDQLYFNGSQNEGAGMVKLCPVTLNGASAINVPSGFTVAASHNSNVMYWDYSPEFSGYTLQASTSLGGTYSTIASPTATGTYYTHAVTSPVQNYFYKITGTATDGCTVGYTSPVSSLALEQTYYGGSQNDGTARTLICNVQLNGVNYIAPPSNVFAATSHNASVLFWDQFSDPAVTQYNVLWSNDPGFSSYTTQPVTGGLTNWTHANTTTGTNYYYKVGGVYTDGCLTSYSSPQLVVPTSQLYVDGGLDDGSGFSYSCFSSTLNGITPLISPAGPLDLCVGQTPTLTSTSANYYQWYLNNNPISLQTNQTYTVTSAGSYKVQVTAPTGCTAQSLPVVVNYNGPQMVSQSGDISTCETFDAGFVYKVNAWQPSFQWYYSDNNGSSWNTVPNSPPYSGTNSDSLVVTGIYSGLNNYLYRCIATAGSCQITSANKTLSVNPNTWTGTADNQWENASNWPCGLPTTQMDVKIPTSPVGGLFPTVFSRNAVSKNLIIDSLAFVTINPGGKIDIGGTLMNKGSFLIDGFAEVNSDLTNNGLIAVSDSLFVHGAVTNNDSLMISGLTIIDSNITNNSSGLISVTDSLATTGNWNNQGTVDIAGALNIEKNWDGNGTYNFNGNLYFTGNTNSVIDGANFAVDNIHISKGSNAVSVEINNELTVNDTAYFDAGTVVVNTPGGLMVFAENAAAKGVSDNSFVSGPVKKLGDGQPFIFPTGDVSGGAYVWAPIELSGFPTGDAFTAEYFYNAASEDPNQRDATLDSISTREYWTLDRSGTSSPWVTLHWKDSARSNIPAVGALQVVHWDGSKWKNHGGAGMGSASGYITNSIAFTSYSPITFGYNSNSPLPIELLSFDASCNNGEVTASWSTATETNNDYFTLERSTDLKSWEVVSVVDGAGNSNTLKHYSARCSNPYNTTTYYRLKQTDFDGQFSYSTAVAIDCQPESWYGTSVYPNPASDYLFIAISLPVAEKVTLKVFNLMGQEVFAREITVDGQQTYYMSLDGLAAGNYKYSVISKTQMYQGQFIKVNDIR